MQQQQQTNNQVCSLSFNTYTSSKLTDIAARVVQECQNDDHFNDLYCDEKFNDLEPQRFSLRLDEQSKFEPVTKSDCDDDDDDDGERGTEESEFSFNCRGSETTSPISADDIFYNGQIKVCYYPLFDTNLLLDHHDDDVDTVQIKTVLDLHSNNDSKPPPPRRLSLRSLMKEETSVDQLPSCSSSDADELEGLPPGTYCVWKPKTEQESLANRKKSSSTGTSKRWRFRNLLKRSNSEGKDENKLGKSVSFRHEKFAGIPKTNSDVDLAAAARVMKEDEKRRSYLPYKRELFGIFEN